MADPEEGRAPQHGRAGPEPVRADAAQEQFRADVIEFLREVSTAARSGYLPVYLPQDADLGQMARTVRMLGEVRRGAAAAGGAQARTDSDDERAQVYELP